MKRYIKAKQNITCMTTTRFQVVQILTVIPGKDFTRQQLLINTSTIIKASTVTLKIMPFSRYHFRVDAVEHRLCDYCTGQECGQLLPLVVNRGSYTKQITCSV